jgi:hypothetical protein
MTKFGRLAGQIVLTITLFSKSRLRTVIVAGSIRPWSSHIDVFGIATESFDGSPSGFALRSGMDAITGDA